MALSGALFCFTDKTSKKKLQKKLKLPRRKKKSKWVSPLYPMTEETVTKKLSE